MDAIDQLLEQAKREQIAFIKEKIKQRAGSASNRATLSRRKKVVRDVALGRLLHQGRVGNAQAQQLGHSMKHTPSPWRLEETTLAVVRLIVTPEEVHAFKVSPEKEQDRVIAYVPSDYKRKEQITNARLIVKAPEMYALLKELVEHYSAGETIRGADFRFLGAEAWFLLKEIENEASPARR